MAHYRKFPARIQRFHIPLPVCMLLFLFSLCLTTTPVFSQGQTTTFLPLKVNSLTNIDSITEQADGALSKVLSRNGMHPLPRSQAEKLANYQGNWPPAISNLQQVAQETGLDNVAAGSLTMVGNQVSIDIKLFDLLSPANPTYYFRNVESLEDVEEALAGIVDEILAYTNREFRIAAISPQGNTRIDSGAILRKISSKTGGAYSPATLREDLKAIYSMGYFNDVQIDVTDGPEGKNIVFRVVEKPVISAVTFSGLDELKEEEVRSAANIREHFILNPNKVNAGVEAIKELYKSKGYYNTQVKAEITFPTDAGAVVSYFINEGKKIYIKEISFEGNSAFDDDELKDEMETGEKGFFSWLTASGLLEMDKIKRDANRIVAFYHNNGYLEAKISEPEVRQEEEWLYLTFAVEEGPRFKVGTIDLTGDLITDKSTLLDLLTIRDQEHISSQIVREDILALTDYYSEKGYAFATIRPQLAKSTSGTRIDINFGIDKGDLVYINRITIRGNTRTRDNVIRRELRIAEGGIFDSKALRDSTKALQRLQFFEEVNVTPEPALDPSRMNIVIEVKERSTGTFSIGAGYSSVDDLILMGQISENNFLGRGDKLQLSANIGGESNRYNLGYTNPRVNDSALSWGLDLFSTEREYDDYTKESKGGGVRIGYPVWEKWRLFGNYSYTDTDLTNVSDEASYIIRNSVDLPVTSAIKLSLVRDSRNKFYGATEGSRHLLSVKYAGGPLGGDGEFTKVEGSTSWYFPLVLETTFHFKAAAGQVFENEDDRLPVYERFYLGGMSSIRGFDYAKVSPTDPISGERIGGDKMWYTNFEFIFPLLESQGIQGLVFYDMGQVLEEDDDWGFDDFEKSVGLGIRWLSPMGPLSIVWGLNLDPADDEDDSVWDFSIGGTF